MIRTLFLAGAALVALAAPAGANPRSLPFTYPYETLAAGRFEFEQFADLIPVRVGRELPDGTLEGIFSIRSILTTEFEYGITDHLEFGWYFQFQQGASAQAQFLQFDGVKQRLRWRLADPDVWPVNVGLYLELAELRNELEVEDKLILSRRFGIVNVVVNLWFEHEYKFQDDEFVHLYSPTAGVTFELSPHVIVGGEYWGRGRFDQPEDTRHFAGPTLLLQSGEFWLSVGAYLRLDDLTAGYVVDDPNGKFWVRTVLGIGL